MIEYMEERTKVVLYARVSTSAQDYTRQNNRVEEIRQEAELRNCEGVQREDFGR